MISRTTNDEYFAYYLMQERDLLAVKKESQLDNTMASAYFFANRSEWLGSRSEIRNWLLQEIMPNLGRLIRYFPGETPRMPPKEQVVADALPHLLAVNQLSEANGARLVVVVPPTLSQDDASAAVQDSAAKDGIPVLVPMWANDVTPEDFDDGFHLNPRAQRDSPRASLPRSSKHSTPTKSDFRVSLSHHKSADSQCQSRSIVSLSEGKEVISPEKEKLQNELNDPAVSQGLNDFPGRR